MQNCQYCHKNATKKRLLGFSICPHCAVQLPQTHEPSRHNAYIYTRVSTKQQNTDDDSGIFIQTRQCLEYCFEHNITCHGIYQDIHSAFNMQNTGLVGLRQMIIDLGFNIWIPRQCHAKNKLVIRLRNALQESQRLLLIKETTPDPHIDYIIVANMDRFGRDILNMITLKNQLAVHDIHIISVCQSIKTGTDLGEMAFRREALEAEMFSRDKSYRMKSVKATKRALGNFMGGRPRFGYTIRRIQGIRRQIEDPSEQQTISLISRLHHRGKSFSAIARELNMKKISYRGKKWARYNISRIVSVNDMDTTDIVNDLKNFSLDTLEKIPTDEEDEDEDEDVQMDHSD